MDGRSDRASFRVRSEVEDANDGHACDSFAYKRRLVCVVNLPFGLVVEDAAVIGFKVRVNITSSLFLHIVTDLLTHSLTYELRLF